MAASPEDFRCGGDVGSEGGVPEGVLAGPEL